MEDKFKLMHLYKEHPQKVLAMLTIRFHNKEGGNEWERKDLFLC